MRRCLSCGRTPESKPYFGDKRCTPSYCCEQGINPRSPEHTEKRKRVRYEASKWPRPKGWRLHIFYNLGWHAFLRAPGPERGVSVSPRYGGGFHACGPFYGEGRTVRAALLNAATNAHNEARRVADLAKLYGDAAASI